MVDFKECLEKRRIVPINATGEMIKKEMDNAVYDLSRSEESLMKKDYKWSSVQAYYSMFHSAKALILKQGYREKSHYCLLVALRELLVNRDLISKDIVDNYELCMDIRHEADYGHIYSDESAELAVDAAKKMLKAAQQIIKKK